MNQDSPLRFSFRIVGFVVPLVIIFGIFELALWKAKDTWSTPRVLRYQLDSNEEVLFSRGFFDQDFVNYKINGINMTAAEIVSIGSSRIMQLRSQMFYPLEFYNAGGIIRDVGDIIAFNDLMSRNEIHRPELLILGLDPWWLKSNFDENAWLASGEAVYDAGKHIDAISKIIRAGRINDLFDMALGPAGQSFEGVVPIGAGAMNSSAGFRADGSMSYDPRLFLDYLSNGTYEDRENPPIIQRVLARSGRFSTPAIFDISDLLCLVDVLSEMEDSGTEVVVLLLPFSSEILEILSTDEDYSDWWGKYLDKTSEILISRNIETFDFTDGRYMGLDDRYMIDGFHPGEVYAAHMIRNIVRSNRQGGLLDTINISALDSLIRNSASELSLYPPARAVNH